jgi:predicted Zn-dependent protease
VSTVDDMVRALSDERQLAEWKLYARYSRAAWVTRGGGKSAVSSGERTATTTTVTIHVDGAAGRGSATFALGAGDSIADALPGAVMRARQAVGPAWRSPPPAAPARVTVADPKLDTASLARVPGEIAGQVAASAKAAGAELLDVHVEIAIEAVQIVTRRGIDARWPETLCTVEARLSRDGAIARLARTVRRRDELSIGAAVADAVDAAIRRAKAPQTPLGRFPTVLRAPALLHGGRGLFEALIAQADPALERQGLVRYRPGQPIAPGAVSASEPLTITSDGTLPFGLRSAPLDEQGMAVRRFELVGRGVARDLSLDGREASLRRVSPNGGVRGIVVPPGEHSEASLLDGGPLLVIDAWSWLDLAPVTGQFRGAIALGRIIDGTGSHDVKGGIVRGDALETLALSVRSKETVTTPEYHGPATWAVGDLDVD